VDVLNVDPVLAETPYVIYTATRQTNWFNEHQLLGSAARYLPEDYDQDLANKLFAADFYPEGYCSQPEYSSKWCVEYSSRALNVKLPVPSPPVLLPDIGERIYSVSTTNTGPSVYETLQLDSSRWILRGPALINTMEFDAGSSLFNTYLVSLLLVIAIIVVVVVVVCLFLTPRSDGVIGYSMPCDEDCNTCTLMVWEDSPYGYLIEPILECSESDDGATQLYCDKDQLKIYNYDNCQQKNCQIISYPPPQDDGDDANVLCFFAGTKDSCVQDQVFAYQDCTDDRPISELGKNRGSSSAFRMIDQVRRDLELERILLNIN
jgi:hypothetical protein